MRTIFLKLVYSFYSTAKLIRLIEEKPYRKVYNFAITDLLCQRVPDDEKFQVLCEDLLGS